MSDRGCAGNKAGGRSAWPEGGRAHELNPGQTSTDPPGRDTNRRG